MQPFVFGMALIGSVGVAFLSANGLLRLIFHLMTGTRQTNQLAQPDASSQLQLGQEPS